MRRIFALTLVLCGVLLSGCGDESEDTESGPVECEYLTLPDVAYPQETEFVDAPPEGTRSSKMTKSCASNGADVYAWDSVRRLRASSTVLPSPRVIPPRRST